MAIVGVAVGDSASARTFDDAMSDSLGGPFRMPHEAAPCAGGGDVFRDKDGLWWSTFFSNDEQSHVHEKPGLIRFDFDPRGRIVAADDQPFALPLLSGDGIDPQALRGS